VANSLAAIECGARGVDAPSRHRRARGHLLAEEQVMALKVRNDHYGIQPRAEQELFATSRLVSQLRHMVQRHKALVGANALRARNGIHQDGMLKHSETYEIMRPETSAW
jgi:2-isopropylmalate synthase